MTHKHFAPCLFEISAFGLGVFGMCTVSGCTQRPPSSVTVMNPQLRLQLKVRPPHPRQMDLTQVIVNVMDAQKRPVTGATLETQWSMPTMAMPPETVWLHPQSPGRYAGLGRFSMPGSWRVTVTATRGPERTRQPFDVTVR